MWYFFRGIMGILTLEPLPEDQFKKLTAGREVRVGVSHLHVSIRLQVQHTHCEGDTNNDSGCVVGPRDTDRKYPRFSFYLGH